MNLFQAIPFFIHMYGYSTMDGSGLSEPAMSRVDPLMYLWCMVFSCKEIHLEKFMKKSWIYYLVTCFSSWVLSNKMRIHVRFGLLDRSKISQKVIERWKLVLLAILIQIKITGIEWFDSPATKTGLSVFSWSLIGLPVNELDGVLA